MESEELLVREIDDQGRITLPASWRKKFDTKRFKLIVKEDEIVIKPLSKKRLSDLFDSIEVDVRSPLTDWKKLKKELLLGWENEVH